ncbi:30055_t:CDS:2, partial [Racocetra persica]
HGGRNDSRCQYLQQLAYRHKIDHASSVEYYGVMNDRPNTLAPKQENKGKISVKALIDTLSKFNTISKSLFDKLKEDYRICDPVENLYKDVI